MPDSIVNAYEESDVLDPRTDAERPSVPPVIKPVDLGPVHVETPVVLSPMAGVTNWPFRVGTRVEHVGFLVGIHNAIWHRSDLFRSI